MSRDETRAESPVDRLQGIGPKRAVALRDAGLNTVEDLLFHLPLRYEDKREPVPLAAVDGKRLFRLTVTSVDQGRTGRGGRLHRLQALAEDSHGTVVTLRWLNQPFRARSIEAGKSYCCFGQVVADSSGKGSGLLLDNPELEEDRGDEGILQPGPHLGRIVPVYRRVGGVGSRVIRTALHRIFQTGFHPAETSAAGALKAHGFPRRSELFRGIHCPPNGADPSQLNARGSIWQRGLAFEELYLQQRLLAEKKRRRLASRKKMIDGGSNPLQDSSNLQNAVEGLTGFRLTAEQRLAIADIVADLGQPHPMRRLLQGEVGCGKTVVAYAALFHAVAGGRQAALMAPTEALAWQHFHRLEQLLRSAPAKQPLRKLAERIILVTGGSDARRRRELKSRLAGPEPLIAIGTHALLTSSVVFRDLSLAVVDEQQRFGVGQREQLRSKGTNPDLLVISATPIPRTMGLRLCGDMELSRIRELPLGRRDVSTLCLEPDQAAHALDLLEQELTAGRQGFVVCPTVHDRGGQKRAAETVYRKFQTGRLSRYPAGLLHGGMGLDESREVMDGFQRGNICLLITTTVVEVGLDVPRATVMIVLEPERFGLSQLHQLRGRIGRGKWPGQFILLRSMDDTKGEAASRLAVLVSSDDGFHIAEEDFRLRGGGELTGRRQAGAPEYRTVFPAAEGRLLTMARATAFRRSGLDAD